MNDGFAAGARPAGHAERCCLLPLLLTATGLVSIGELIGCDFSVRSRRSALCMVRSHRPPPWERILYARFNVLAVAATEIHSLGQLPTSHDYPHLVHRRSPSYSPHSHRISTRLCVGEIGFLCQSLQPFAGLVTVGGSQE